MIIEPGIYSISEAEYHADPCEPFSLSRGIAHKIITENPRKAYHASPKLGGHGGLIPNKSMDAGSMVHRIVLGKGAEIEVVRAVYGPKHARCGEFVDDYATAAAKEARDAIRARGRIPVLAHEEPGIRACAVSALEQLRDHPDGGGFFEPGRSEAVVVWQEDDCWFRVMVDRLPDNPRASPYDFKATKLSAAPGDWDRRLQQIYAFQDSFYRRGLKAVRGIMPSPMLFPVIELDEPYCLAVHAAAPSLQDIADRQVERAIAAWKRCVKTGQWPGYPAHTAWVEAPNWMINAAQDQEIRDEMMEAAQ